MEDNNNSNRSFSGKNVSGDKEKFENYIKSKGSTDLGDSIQNLNDVQKTFEEVREVYLEEVREVENELDPKRKENEEAYSFFSPVISREIWKFKESLEKGDSIEEVDIREVAEENATTRSRYASDILNSPISRIVGNYVTIKKLEDSESYDEIDNKIREAGAGSIPELLDFFNKTFELIEDAKKAGTINTRDLKETIDKHNIILSAVAVILEGMGIKNPNFEGQDKKLEKYLSDFTPRGIENNKVEITPNTEIPKSEVIKTTEEKTIEKTINSEKVTEKNSVQNTRTETSNTEVAKRETNQTSTNKERSLESLTILSSNGTKETTAPTTPAASVQSSILSLTPEIKTTTKETNTDNTRTQPQTEKTAAPPNSMDSVRMERSEKPNDLKNSIASSLINSLTGIKVDQSNKGSIEGNATESSGNPIKSTASNIIDQLGLGGLIGEATPNSQNQIGTSDQKNDGNQKKLDPQTTQKESSGLSIDQIKSPVSIKNTLSEKSAQASAIVERSPLKMLIENKDQLSKDKKGEESTMTSESNKKIEPLESNSESVETKPESKVKYETRAKSKSESMEGGKSEIDSQILSSILVVMQEIRDTLNGPIIVTNSENNFG